MEQAGHSIAWRDPRRNQGGSELMGVSLQLRVGQLGRGIAKSRPIGVVLGGGGQHRRDARPCCRGGHERNSVRSEPRSGSYENTALATQ